MKLFVTVRRNRAQECIDAAESQPVPRPVPAEWRKDAASRRLEIRGDGGAYYGELSVPEDIHEEIASAIGMAFGTAVEFHT